MKKKETPHETGISSITGKTIQIRHATANDLYFIEQSLRKHGYEEVNPDPSNFVIAVEDGHVLGFGHVKRAEGKFAIVALVVEQENRKAGIGSIIVRHILETAPAKEIYAVTKDAGFFEHLGFVRLAGGDDALKTEFYEACGVSDAGGTSVLVLTKTTKG